MVHITTTVCHPAGYICTGIAPLLMQVCVELKKGSLSSQSRSYFPSLEERVAWTVRLVFILFMVVHVPTTVCPPAGYQRVGRLSM